MRGNNTFQLHMETSETSRRRKDAEYYYDVINTNLEWQVDVRSSERFLRTYILSEFINKHAPEELKVCEVPTRHKFWAKDEKHLIPINQLDNFIEKAYADFGRFDKKIPINRMPRLY